MGRRIEFKAVLNDLAQSLGTRNNDYLGYWAPGQLYKLALDLGVSNIIVDIFENQVNPACEHFDKLPAAYKKNSYKYYKPGNECFVGIWSVD